MSKNVI